MQLDLMSWISSSEERGRERERIDDEGERVDKIREVIPMTLMVVVVSHRVVVATSR